MRKRILLFLFLSMASHALGQDVCPFMRQQASTIYGFHPAKLSDAGRTQKSNLMDGFWDYAKKHKQESPACLQSLLRERKDDGFFQFDAASLLWNLDQSVGSKAAVREALALADLNDVRPDEFVRFALRLSKQGLDIGEIASKYLHERNVTAYLAAHGGYELSRVPGSILLYGSMDPDKVDEYLEKELSSPVDYVRDTAAIILAMNMTERSFRTLSNLDVRPLSKEAKDTITAVLQFQKVVPVSAAKYTREQMLEKLGRLPEIDSMMTDAENKALDNSIYASFRLEDLPALRAARRRMIQSVSNESVDGYQELSRMLLVLINRLDAYPQCRKH